MIAFRESGKAKRVTHVLLHGIGSNADSWQYQLEAVSSRSDIKVIAWDAPGYRSSLHLAVDKPITADYAHAMWEWLDQQNIAEQITLVGHSLGCLISASAASMRPKSVSKLILLSPARGYGEADEAERQEKLQSRLSVMHALGIDGMAKSRSAMLIAPNSSETVQKLAYELMSQLNPRGYTQAATMLVNGNIFTDLLQVQCPITVAVGNLDTVTTPAACTKLAIAVKTDLIDLGAVGHYVSLEAPQAVCQTIFPQPL